LKSIGKSSKKHIKNNLIDPLNLIVEQGHEIEKDGRVKVQVSKSNGSFNIEITGNATYVKDFQVVLDS